MGGIFSFLRTAGPSLSPFNAWVILKGMETLKIRMEAHSANALEVARWLETQPCVSRVYYPGLPSHPQHELARRQQKSGGGIVSFELKNGKEAAWQVVDSVRADLDYRQPGRYQEHPDSSGHHYTRAY